MAKWLRAWQWFRQNLGARLTLVGFTRIQPHEQYQLQAERYYSRKMEIGG